MPRTAADLQEEIDELVERRKKIADELDMLSEKEDITNGDVLRSKRQMKAFDRLSADIEILGKERNEILRHAEKVDRLRSLASNPRNRDLTDDERAISRNRGRARNDGLSDMVQRALRTLDQDGGHLDAGQGDAVDGLLRRAKTEEYSPDYLAERTLITENDAYRSAWQQYLTSAQHNTPLALTAEEAAALRSFQEFERGWASRSMNEGTTTAGGFGVPVFIDASVILTTGALDAPLLNVMRIEQVTNNQWKGVSSAGMSWSYDAEAAAVSDDSPTLAQPSVNVYTARGWIPYSLEVGMDYPGFQREMTRILGQGYMDLLASQTCVGSGSSQPRGIFTALDANTNVEVLVTTDGSFGGVDVFKVWNALRERFRSRATWLMSVSVESAIRQFAAAAGSSSSYFTVDLTQSGVTRINGRPTIVTDYAPALFAASTPASNVLVVGDFSHFLMAQRIGMNVEAVPHLFDTTTNRPTGERGLFAYSRHGFDSVADTAFRLLQQQ